MTSKISIQVGPQGKCCVVDAIPILGGLAAHKSPDRSKKSGVLNITHTSSGLSILQYVQSDSLPVVIEMLGRVKWNITAELVYASQRHFNLIKKVGNMLTSKQRSDRQEDRSAKDLSGKRQPASGSRWGYRRDVITPNFLVEAKTTETEKFRVSDKDLDYLRTQAYEKGRVPVYVIELSGQPEVTIIPSNDIDPTCLEVGGGLNKQVNKKDSKSFSLNIKVVKFVNDGGSVTVTMPSGDYTIVGYEQFLEMAKVGV